MYSMDLRSAIFSFLDEHISKVTPLLVAASGGPDSMCLLDLVAKWGHPDIHVVHVNHGWRKESDQECEMVCSWAKNHNMHFHTTKLDPSGYKGNLEQESRAARFAFFQEVAKATGSNTILLGHHADDQAETVFKRVLECSSLCSLSGIKVVTHFGTLRYVRPFLLFKKAQLLSYLGKEKIAYCTDATNDDVAFLRARMRKEIFPYLQNAFGKVFEKNLCLLASEAEQLSSYMKQKIDPFIQQAQVCAMGCFFKTVPTHEFELKHFVKQVCEGDFLSREQVSDIVRHMIKRSANIVVIGNKNYYFVDRGFLFVIHRDFSLPEQADTLKIGLQHFGPWNIFVEKVRKRGVTKNCWLHLFNGESVTYVPDGPYTICSRKLVLHRQMSEKKCIKILSKYFNTKKVPRILQDRVPMIVNQSKFVVEDFLTASSTDKRNEADINAKDTNAVGTTSTDIETSEDEAILRISLTLKD